MRVDVPPTAMRVALTFDDLPVHGQLPPGQTRMDVARSIIDTLQSWHAPPTYGLVNAKSLEQAPETIEVLRLWRASGNLLGNHTYSHMDLDANTAEAFEQDILAAEATLRAEMGAEDWHWFRYPYLREGETPEKRAAVAQFLAKHGYRIAEVTLNFDDWAFNDPYARCAAANDTQAIEWMEQSYLERVAQALALGPAEARKLYGRDISHVLLLHLGAFETVMLPKLMQALQDHHVTLVTLPEAASDAVYSAEAQQEGRPDLATQFPVDLPHTQELMARLAGLCQQP